MQAQKWAPVREGIAFKLRHVRARLFSTLLYTCLHLRLLSVTTRPLGQIAAKSKSLIIAAIVLTGRNYWTAK